MTPGQRKTALGIGVAAGIFFGMATLSPAGSGRRVPLPLEIRILHADACTAPQRGEKPCRRDADWSLRLEGRLMVGPEELRSALRREADRSRSGLQEPRTSERGVVIRGEDTAPWGLVQRCLNECAKVGIYQIDWSVLERGKNGPLLKAWLPTFKQGREEARRDEIRIFMRWDGQEASRRKVGNRGQVSSDEDLMEVVLQMVADGAKAGRTTSPILIDATPDVPWKEIVHVVELCRKEKLESIEFAAPFEQR